MHGHSRDVGIHTWVQMTYLLELLNIYSSDRELKAKNGLYWIYHKTGLKLKNPQTFKKSSIKFARISASFILCCHVIQSDTLLFAVCVGLLASFYVDSL